MNGFWRPIPGYEGLYEISALGVVKSLAREGTRGRFLYNNTEPSGTRYKYVFLCKDGVPKRYRVHTLVLMAFVGPRPKGKVARHLDSNPANNSIINLSWGTPKENMADERARGFGPLRNFKFTAEDIIRIRRLRGKMRQIDIASDYDVSLGAIRNIHQGKTWRHIL